LLEPAQHFFVQNQVGSMSAADPENQGKPGSDPADASFERLLAQLETASPAGPALQDGSVSQIFSALPGADALPDPAATAVLPAHAEAVKAPAASVKESAAFKESGAFSPAASIRADESTRITPRPAGFEAAAPGVSAQPAMPAASATPAAAAAPAQPVPASRAFEPAEPPGTKPQPAEAKPQVAQEGPGEFTRIFTQLPTPRSAPPAILGDLPVQPVAARPPAPGEFTQFFQARDQAGLQPPATSAAAAKPPAPPLPEPFAPREPGAAREPATREPVPSRDAFAPQPPAMPAALDAPAPPRAASQAFAPASAFAPSPAADAAFARPAREPQGPAAAAEPGEFTALFQAPFAGPSAPNAGPAPAFTPPAPQPSSCAPAPGPVFAEPEPLKPNSAASGGFTELLRSLSDGNPAAGSPAPAQAPSFPQAAPGSRLDAFSPVAAPAPQPSGNQFSADQSFAARVPDPAGPFAPPKQAPPAGSSGPGEFTQLMQSLASPGASKPAAAAPPAQTPFFSENAKLSTAGPSEFTRVIQGSAARSAQAPPATFTPAAPSSGGAAVGLPIATPQMPKPPAPPAVEPKTTLQKLMPWLLVANGLLLILLVVLAVVFLKRH